MAGGPKNKEIQSNTKEKISSQQKFNSKQTVEHFFPTRPATEKQKLSTLVQELINYKFNPENLLKLLTQLKNRKNPAQDLEDFTKEHIKKFIEKKDIQSKKRITIKLIKDEQEKSKKNDKEIKKIEEAKMSLISRGKISEGKTAEIEKKNESYEALKKAYNNLPPSVQKPQHRTS